MIFLIKFIVRKSGHVMKVLLLLFFILIGYTDLSAQDSTLITIKTGERVTDVLTSADKYYYPQFTNGKVFLRDGSKGAAKMNYNRLYGQMLFINPQGDTLALADEKNIKFIVIDRDTFHYGEGYVRLIANYGVVKLAEKQIWVVADVRKIGTHGTPTNTVAITSLSNYSDANGRAKSYDLLINEDIIMRKETQYYFGDEYSHFVRTSKKRLLNLFPKEERSIENYLKENKVNFDKKDDLEKLCQFLSQLH
jgi:hypothetical protein